MIKTTEQQTQDINAVATKLLVYFKQLQLENSLTPSEGLVVANSFAADIIMAFSKATGADVREVARKFDRILMDVIHYAHEHPETFIKV
jgi:hypothetical protein